MRITQGTFSFLPDMTDEQIAAQIRYSLQHGWAMSVEYTDDPHPRNSYWEMWAPPAFDLEVRRLRWSCARSARAARRTPITTSSSTPTTPRWAARRPRCSFIVGRPAQEPGYRLERTDAHDRVIRYSLHPYATDKPAGRRYAHGNGTKP